MTALVGLALLAVGGLAGLGQGVADERALALATPSRPRWRRENLNSFSPRLSTAPPGAPPHLPPEWLTVFQLLVGHPER